MMKISILGTGAYGLALSFMFHENYHNISMWTAFEEEKKMLETERRYEKVLPNIKIKEEINFTWARIIWSLFINPLFSVSGARCCHCAATGGKTAANRRRYYSVLSAVGLPL